MQKQTSTMNPMLAFVAGGALTLLAMWLLKPAKKEKSLEDQFEDAMNEERYIDAGKIRAKMQQQNPSVKELKKMMDEAAAKEDYDKAIVFRDEISRRTSRKAI